VRQDPAHRKVEREVGCLLPLALTSDAPEKPQGADSGEENVLVVCKGEGLTCTFDSG
jgi:hypothetical protein